MSLVIVTDNKSTIVNSAGPRGLPGSALSPALIDLNGVWSIHETASSPILIAATSEPSTPQLTVTVPALPSNNFVQDYGAIFQMGAQSVKTDGGSYNFQFTKNGSDVSGMSGVNSFGSATLVYDYLAGLFATLPITAGDVLGIKLWNGDPTETFYYLNSSLYIVPRILGPAAGKQVLAFTLAQSPANAYNGNGPTGSLAGVTYQNHNILANTNQAIINDTLLGVSINPLSGPMMVSTLNSFVNIASFSGTPGVFVNTSFTASIQSTTPILASLNRDGSWIRYYQTLS